MGIWRSPPSYRTSQIAPLKNPTSCRTRRLCFYHHHRYTLIVPKQSKMSDFKAKPLFEQIEEGLKGMDDKEKKDIQKKVSQTVRCACRRRRAQPSISCTDQRCF
jgi:hypothetical protein